MATPPQRRELKLGRNTCHLLAARRPGPSTRASSRQGYYSQGGEGGANVHLHTRICMAAGLQRLMSTADCAPTAPPLCILDYLKPAMRMAALMKCLCCRTYPEQHRRRRGRPNISPIEHLASIRAIPDPTCSAPRIKGNAEAICRPVRHYATALALPTAQLRRRT